MGNRVILGYEFWANTAGLKFRYSEKATKISKNKSNFALTLLSIISKKKVWVFSNFGAFSKYVTLLWKHNFLSLCQKWYFQTWNLCIHMDSNKLTNGDFFLLRLWEILVLWGTFMHLHNIEIFLYVYTVQNSVVLIPHDCFNNSIFIILFLTKFFFPGKCIQIIWERDWYMKHRHRELMNNLWIGF